MSACTFSDVELRGQVAEIAQRIWDIRGAAASNDVFPLKIEIWRHPSKGSDNRAVLEVVFHILSNYIEKINTPEKLIAFVAQKRECHEELQKLFKEAYDGVPLEKRDGEYDEHRAYLKENFFPAL